MIVSPIHSFLSVLSPRGESSPKRDASRIKDTAGELNFAAPSRLAHGDILRLMRKSSMVRLAAVAALVLGGSWMAYTQGRGPAASKLDTVKIKDDLFVIHNEAAPGNVTVLVTNDGVLLVDDKFAV